ncbi:acyltransferase family protein [Weissella hellenica]|uniref:Acetyltransferase n=1 Tax=Weissella hellenica TaxID=46256 RepID=A0A4Y4G818_WEIHE|nr:acyltransferase family protein [Weissella hellenica]NKY66323.1 acetyltransferase [Weissella hellenica]GED36584.1 acyltransferase [Weissella hellenica]SCC11509.1 Peptidoglycan/LPS O-acetylase OafA/YrhL, contains acyltransferase and SGNH-hydrolase domains [Weissella hellenica]
MSQDVTNKPRYITGFDGLRAIAVIGVIIFHLWPNALPGGWMGVPLFFVLSGYLITDLLIQEYDRNGRIDVLAFYKRRVKRLYPALVIMLFGTATYIALFARDLLYNLRAIIGSNMLYLYNIWATKNGDSYFDSWGGSSPFTHLWSLSIEGQFYLIWPIIVMLLLGLRIRRISIGFTLIGVAGVSAILLGLLYDPMNINRAYYGSDTRVFAVLFGAALAFGWPSKRMKQVLSPRVKRNLNTLGAIALALTIVTFFGLNGEWRMTYMGLMFVVTAIMTSLIAITAHPASFLSHALDNKFFNYLGKRSYSIYLYQLPVFVFVDRLVKQHDTFWMDCLKIIIVLLLAELSYRYVENVFRHMKQSKPWYIAFVAQRRVQMTVVVALLLTLGTAYAVSAQETAHAKPKNTLEKRLDTNKDRISQANKKVVEQAKKADSKKTDSHKVDPKTLSQADRDLMSKYSLSADQFSTLRDQRVTAVGDSVMVDVAPDLQELMPNTVVNATVGRQAYSIPDILESYDSQGLLSQNVIISIGTNGTIGENDFKKVMDLVGKDRQVFWINGFANRDWVDKNNSFLSKQDSQYKNLHIVDWAALVKDHPDWLGDDKVHPNQDGSLQYASLIAKIMAGVYKDADK